MFQKTKQLSLFLMMIFLASLSAPAFADNNLGKISGYKFNDLNGNGIDDNEPRLPGFTITVTSKTSDYEDTEVTDNQGRFSFHNLPSGKYKVCETAPEATPPWTPTTPECVKVTLRGKAPHVKVRFGNRQVEAPRGQITGLKFNDLNGNGTLDAGEVALAGWVITINGITDPTFEDDATTGTDGLFAFTNLPLGEYEICEVPQSGWQNTSPICVTRELTAEVLSLSAFFGNQVVINGDVGCTLTQGFWKNKAGEILMGQLIPVGGLLLGTTAYNVTQLQGFLNTPVLGNALMNLAHQLIAAKFNLLNGANGTALGTAISDADTLIGSLVVGVDVVTNGAQPVLFAQMIAVKDILDSFNNGDIGPGHCGDN